MPKGQAMRRFMQHLKLVINISILFSCFCIISMLQSMKQPTYSCENFDYERESPVGAVRKLHTDVQYESSLPDRKPDQRHIQEVSDVTQADGDVKPVFDDVSKTDENAPDPEFVAAVEKRVNPQGIVIAASVIDSDYFESAYNFYISSIQRLGLQDHTLFMCVDKAACDRATERGLHTYLYQQFDKEDSGDFASKVFKQKAFVKHYLVYDILLMGHSVLLTDLDMHWFKSPVEVVRQKCDGCDFAAQSEIARGVNIGFMLVHPTKNSLRFYKQLIDKAESLEKTPGAQDLFNNVLTENKRKHQINHKLLDYNNFPEGKTYFEEAKRLLPDKPPCKFCFICHNNFIVGTEAKRYRFREHLMWMVDDGEYYSSKERKYITYENPTFPVPPKSSATAVTTDDEIDALQGALAVAEALGRTLILPHHFHGAEKAGRGYTKLPLNGVALIRNFDAVYDGKYRESSFLRHPLIPDQIKASQCGPFVVKNQMMASYPNSYNRSDIIYINPSDDSGKISLSDIKTFFSSGDYENCSVIKFHSLYRSVTVEDNSLFKSAFVRGTVRQTELIKKSKSTTNSSVGKPGGIQTARSIGSRVKSPYKPGNVV